MRHSQRKESGVTELVRFLHCHTQRQEVEWWLLGAGREEAVTVEWYSFEDGEGWFLRHVKKANATELYEG